MNTDKIIAESIAKDYAPKESSKIVALKKLDHRAKLPATVFTYTLGIVSALVFGTGMCLAMQVIGSGLAAFVLGIVIGIVGLIGCGVNYPSTRGCLKRAKQSMPMKLWNLPAKSANSDHKQRKRAYEQVRKQIF